MVKNFIEKTSLLQSGTLNYTGQSKCKVVVSSYERAPERTSNQIENLSINLSTVNASLSCDGGQN